MEQEALANQFRRRHLQWGRKGSQGANKKNKRG